jgi:hypothetical protein
MFTQESYLMKKFKLKLLSLYHYLENNGVAQFETNGEKLFLENYIKIIKRDKTQKFVFFDIGANIGSYSEVVLSLLNGFDNYLLHLFEPTQSCFTEEEEIQ